MKYSPLKATALATVCVLISAATVIGFAQGRRDFVSRSSHRRASLTQVPLRGKTSLDISSRSALSPTVPIEKAMAAVLSTQQEIPQEFRPPEDFYLRGSRLHDRSGPRDFYFTRAIYSGYGYRRMGSWAVDFPKADRQFLWGLRRLTNIDAYEAENAVRLTDPDLRSFPFLYALEVGAMSLTEAEVEALRSYLLAGGFLMIDDFWGTYEWQNFEFEIRRVLPEYPIVEVGLDHPLFSTFYSIDELVQVPSVRVARYGGVTWERDGYLPHVRGIFDDAGRLLVVINWNTDLGDAWEWAEDPYYPLPYSTFAYQMAVNTIIYALSH
jgi:hypothetical protein